MEKVSIVIDESDEYLGECDCCHDYFDIFQLRVDEGGQFVYCDKCMMGI